VKADGSLDTSFTSGYTGPTGPIPSESYSNVITLHNMTLQPDGKIIVVGAFTNYNGTRTKNIIRLLSDGRSDGSIDPRFNTSIGVERGINEVIIEPITNKIIIGGEFTLYGTTAINKLIRLTTAGDLDPTFSIGTGTTDSTYSAGCPYCINYVRVLKQQTDGKIIVGGKFTTFNRLSATNITRIFGDAGVQAKSSVIEFQSEPEIDTNPNYNAISIYPNPSDGVYYFDLTEEATDTQIQVLNLLGEQVFSGVLKGKQENKIDLSNLAQGCYLVKLSNLENTTTQKLIKK
jgi:hypothetical protein